jgi:hypothetical protein
MGVDQLLRHSIQRRDGLAGYAATIIGINLFAETSIAVGERGTLDNR